MYFLTFDLVNFSTCRLQMVTLIGKLTIGSTVAYQLLNPRSMTRLTASTLRSLLAGLRSHGRRLQQ